MCSLVFETIMIHLCGRRLAVQWCLSVDATGIGGTFRVPLEVPLTTSLLVVTDCAGYIWGRRTPEKT